MYTRSSETDTQTPELLRYLNPSGSLSNMTPYETKVIYCKMIVFVVIKVKLKSFMLLTHGSVQ